MSENKTQETEADVSAFISGIDDERKRADSETIVRMMSAATGAPPKMWGTSIVGFGQYRYRYESGREGDWMLCGFSPRKSNLSLYIMPGLTNYTTLLKKLGKHSTGKSCLYIKTLDDVDLDVLRELIEESVRDMRSKHETTS
jgi:hypothetical protein